MLLFVSAYIFIYKALLLYFWDYYTTLSQNVQGILMGNCKYLHFKINLIGLSLQEPFKKSLHLTFTEDLYLDFYMEYWNNTLSNASGILDICTGP